MIKHKTSIIVTGATSGIGKYAAKILTDRGWTVWAGYRSEEDRDMLQSMNPAHIRPIRIDVTDQNSITQARMVIETSNMVVHALINNAGIAIGGPIELLDIRDIQRVYDVNIFGSVRMIQSFLPLLRKSNGRIINMSSIGGLIGVPFLMPYSSSKFAVEGMSDILRRELLGQGLTVSIIEPGPIQTAIWDKSLKNSQKFLSTKSNSETPYSTAIESMSQLMQNTHFAVPVERLKPILIHACESKRPKTRYFIYRYGALLKYIIAITPSRIADLFFRKYIGY